MQPLPDGPKLIDTLRQYQQYNTTREEREAKLNIINLQYFKLPHGITSIHHYTKWVNLKSEL